MNKNGEGALTLFRYGGAYGTGWHSMAQLGTAWWRQQPDPAWNSLAQFGLPWHRHFLAKIKGQGHQWFEVIQRELVLKQRPLPAIQYFGHGVGHDHHLGHSCEEFKDAIVLFTQTLAPWVQLYYSKVTMLQSPPIAIVLKSSVCSASNWINKKPALCSCPNDSAATLRASDNIACPRDPSWV